MSSIKPILEHFADKVIESKEPVSVHLELRVTAENLKEIVVDLRDKFNFKMLLDVTAVDFLDSDFYPRTSNERFEVVYHFLSISDSLRIRLKVALAETNPEIDSLCEVYNSANFLEREVWDMYGIKFKNHPDLRRILMYEEFEGYPLRKDYPVQAKQPRVPLRHPEVENTAQFMNRPDLVQINKKRPAA